MERLKKTMGKSTETRKVFSIPGTVAQGLLDLGVDDDALVYINGTLVITDRNGVPWNISDVDVTGYLTLGLNLIAVKAHDSLGGNESLDVRLEAEWNAIPEPSVFAALVGVGLLGRWWRRRKRQAAPRVSALTARSQAEPEARVKMAISP